MRKWLRFGCSLLATAILTPLSASAGQAAVPLGTSAAPYGYYEYLPAGYSSGTDEKAVVIFLHGAGQTGDGSSGQLPSVLALGVPRNIEDGAQYPFIAISPQTANEWNVTEIDAMVEFVKGHYRVDPDRIYLTGASLGGGGTWNYAKAHPEKLAAILPVCGSASIPDGSRLINLPTWAFHAWGDPTSSATAQESIRWVDKIAGAVAGTPPTDVMANYPGTFSAPPGAGQTSDQDRTASYKGLVGGWAWATGVSALTGDHLNLTLYHDATHDSWTRTYSNQAVWDWLLAQERDSGICDSRMQLIVPTNVGAATGNFFPLENAFDAQPVASSACEPLGGGTGSDAPAFTGRVGYIDFGPDWQKVRITSTWTRYRAWSTGSQTPYDELWWDDDIDSTNDSGLSETQVNFNTAPSLDTGLSEPWLRDRDLRSSPVTPQARYLLVRTPTAGMSDRAKEYAILGYIQSSSELIVPAGAGTASGSTYFPMEDAFDGQPTLNPAGEPVGGSGTNQGPYLAERAGYIDFGPQWYKVRITATWTQYRNWSIDDQTPYAELWWDDDTDSVNDSGLDETRVNFNTAHGLNTGMTEPWLRDRDLSTTPVIPRARYLLCRSPSGMTDRALEYAIVGFRDPNATP
jgi:poly(3-hydroxybutyrate) depolymerase